MLSEPGMIVAERTEARPAVADERAALFARLRDLRAKFPTIVSSNYDVSDTCNLSCEGCLYFSGINYTKLQGKRTVTEWERLFAAEAERGINFGYFAGAEPSLVPGILRAASRHLRTGMIATNGIKRIPEDIRYRIHVSLWGDEAASRELRGADNGPKALRNYQGDDRAIAVYTISRRNIDQIVPVSRMCADHGVPITFNYFSPTDDYQARLAGSVTSESDYFHASSSEDNLALTPADLLRAHEAIAEARSRHPDAIWYSLDYDRWITSGEPLYRLDAEGIAIDCGNRVSPAHRHINADLTISTGKCCSPNIDCRECRAYLQGYATLLSRLRTFSKQPRDFRMWLDVWELWMRLFLLPEHRGEGAVR